MHVIFDLHAYFAVNIIVAGLAKDYIYIVSKTKRNDILVSYLESNICKSGAEYARLFTDQNNILASNAVDRTKTANMLNQEGSNIKVLLFVDDFIGTGKSISDNLEAFVDEFPEIKKLNIKIYIGVITGFCFRTS